MPPVNNCGPAAIKCTSMAAKKQRGVVYFTSLKDHGHGNTTLSKQSVKENSGRYPKFFTGYPDSQLSVIFKHFQPR